MEDDSYCETDECIYKKYNDDYAQNVKGWNDQNIDDVFDEHPDVYWNVD